VIPSAETRALEDWSSVVRGGGGHVEGRKDEGKKSETREAYISLKVNN